MKCGFWCISRLVRCLVVTNEIVGLAELIGSWLMRRVGRVKRSKNIVKRVKEGASIVFYAYIVHSFVSLGFDVRGVGCSGGAALSSLSWLLSSHILVW